MQMRHPCIGRRHLEYVSCGSIDEFPERRQRRGQRAEGAEVVRAAVATDRRSMKPEQPGDGPFGRPTVSAEFLAGPDTLAGDAYADALPTHPAAMVSLIVGFVGIRVRMTSGSSAQASLVSTADTATDDGSPARSDSTWISEPVLPPHRVGTGHGSPFFARTDAPSQTARDHSIMSWPPGSSRTARCSRCHRPAVVHSVNRRCAVGTVTPNEGGR